MSFAKNNARQVRGKLVCGAACAAILATGAYPFSTAQAQIISDEIIVTAQKREQDVQDIGVSVTAFSGEQLREMAVTNPRDIADYTPNMNVKNATGAGNPIFNLRGLGITTFVGNGNPTVGVYVDEIYLPTNILMSFSVFDTEAVEVLRGPQGTLFGRNTTGGAVSFRTARPNFAPEGYVNLTYGNYERFTVEAAYSGPLSDTVAARVAVKKDNQSEGFFENINTGETDGEIDTFSFRGSILWEAAPDFEILASIHAGYDRSEPWPFDPVGVYDVSSFVEDDRYPGGGYYGGVFRDQFCASGLTLGPAAIQQDPNCVDRSGFRDDDGDPFTTQSNVNGRYDNHGWGGMLRMEKDFGSFSVISVTGYENFDRDQLEDFDGGPNVLAGVKYDSKIEVFTQELRAVSSGDGPLSWIVGGFFSYDSNETVDVFDTDFRFLGDLAVTYDQRTTSYAGFGHFEYELSDQLKAIVGGRVTYEKTSFDGFQDFVNSADVTGGMTGDVFGLVPVEGTSPMLGFGGVPIALDDTITNTEFTWKFGLDWTPTEDLLIYASVSRGAKSGGYSGFFATIPEEFGPFGPEVIHAYEAGFKATFLDGDLIANGAGYYYDYKNMQTLGFNLNTFIFTIDNLPKVKLNGAEFDLRWRAAEGLELLAGAGWINQAEVIESVSGFAFPLEGNRLPNSPKFTFTATGRYEHELTDNFNLATTISASWKDDQNHQIENRSATFEPAYWLIDARMAFFNPNEDWEIALWVKNLTNEEYGSETFFAGNAGVSNRLVGAPRTYGISTQYKF